LTLWDRIRKVWSPPGSDGTSPQCSLTLEGNNCCCCGWVWLCVVNAGSGGGVVCGPVVVRWDVRNQVVNSLRVWWWLLWYGLVGGGRCLRRLVGFELCGGEG